MTKETTVQTAVAEEAKTIDELHTEIARLRTELQDMKDCICSVEYRNAYRMEGLITEFIDKHIFACEAGGNEVYMELADEVRKIEAQINKCNDVKEMKRLIVIRDRKLEGMRSCVDKFIYIGALRDCLDFNETAQDIVNCFDDDRMCHFSLYQEYGAGCYHSALNDDFCIN